MDPIDFREISSPFGQFPAANNVIILLAVYNRRTLARPLEWWYPDRLMLHARVW